MSKSCCRKGIDRRQVVASPFNLCRLMGRRRTSRRDGDTLNAVAVDNYHPLFMVITLGILLLCFADAFNTLQLLSLGGRELNPMMDVLIRQGVPHFVMAKFALTSLGLLVLVAYHHRAIFWWLKVRHMLYLVLFGYLGLIYYQSHLMPPDILALVLPI